MSPIFYEDSLGEELAEKLRLALAALFGRTSGASGEGSVSSYVDDFDELRRAESEARAVDLLEEYESVSDEWVVAFGPTKLSGLLDVAGINARLVTMPLDAEDLRYVWEPYPPELMPGPAAPYSHAVDRPFALLMPPDDAARGRELLTAHPGANSTGGVVATHDRTPEASAARRTLAWFVLVCMFGPDVATVTILGLVGILAALHVMN